MRSLRNSLAATALLAFGFAALAQQTQTYASTSVAKAAPTKTVKIITKSDGTFAFSPASVTVKVGTRVIWKNVSSAAHTVQSKTSGVFNLGPFNNGHSASFVFKKKGTYKYFCSIHPYMVAKVVVK